MSIVEVITDERLTDATCDLVDQMLGGGKSYTTRQWATLISKFGVRTLIQMDSPSWSRIAELLLVADEVLNDNQVGRVNK